jgi:hypothetical protein
VHNVVIFYRFITLPGAERTVIVLLQQLRQANSAISAAETKRRVFVRVTYVCFEIKKAKTYHQNSSTEWTTLTRAQDQRQQSLGGSILLPKN